MMLRALLTILLSIFLNGCMSSMNWHEGIRSFQKQNFRDAFIRLKPIAENGQPDAEYAVGFMYFYGRGVVESRKKALYWIERAAHHNQPDAKKALKIIGKRVK
jgi:TPR repeat protein